MENYTLIGHSNPNRGYPSQVVPILRIEGHGIFTVYRDLSSKEPIYQKVLDNAAFIPYTTDFDQLAEYDSRVHNLFAFSLNEIELYHIGQEDEYFHKLFGEGKLRLSNPFLNLSISKKILHIDDEFYLGTVRQCLLRLIAKDKGFADDWYQSIRIENKYTESLLPKNLYDFLQDIDIVYIGCSSDKKILFEPFCSFFNQKNYLNSNNKIVQLSLRIDDEHLDEAVRREQIDILCPATENWFVENQIQENYLDKKLIGSSEIILVLNPALYSNFYEEGLGWSETLISLLRYSDFRWIRPRSSTLIGNLVDNAFLHSIQQTRKERLEPRSKEQMIKLIEDRVQKYLSNDSEIINGAIKNGKWLVDAFVIQKQSLAQVLKKLPENSAPIVVGYPKRDIGINHNLLLLNNKENTLQTYYKVIEFFNSESGQPLLRDSNLTPNMALMLSAKEISYARALFSPLQRPLAVYLLIDTSSSMSGEKLERAKAGINAFTILMNADRGDAIGMIEFNYQARVIVPLKEGDNNIEKINEETLKLRSRGQTALIDAVFLALKDIHYAGNHIKAIVLLTDGQENSSRKTISELSLELNQEKNKEIVIYGLSYGERVDVSQMNRICNMTNGTNFSGSTANIKRLYEKIAKKL